MRSNEGWTSVSDVSLLTIFRQRIMGYIESGRKDGAKVHLGGNRFGEKGFYIEPTIFVDAKPDMKIVREEIFGPVGVIIKFEDEAGKCSRTPEKNEATYN